MLGLCPGKGIGPAFAKFRILPAGIRPVNAPGARRHSIAPGRASRDRGELESKVGQNVLLILLAQDLAVVPMLIVVSLLAGHTPD